MRRRAADLPTSDPVAVFSDLDADEAAILAHIVPAVRPNSLLAAAIDRWFHGQRGMLRRWPTGRSASSLGPYVEQLVGNHRHADHVAWWLALGHVPSCTEPALRTRCFSASRVEGITLDLMQASSSAGSYQDAQRRVVEFRSSLEVVRERQLGREVRVTSTSSTARLVAAV